MKRVFILLFLISIGVIINAQNQNLELQIKVFKLDNGLTVILNPDRTTSNIFGGIAVRAGGKDDPKDATGMAHYQEHMLFKGTEELGTVNWEAEKVHIDNIFKLYDELGKTEEPETRASIQKRINEESLKANEYAIPNELDKLIKEMGGTNVNAGTGPDITVYYNAFPSNQVERWLDLYSHRFEKPVFRSFQAELEVVYEEKNMYSDMFIFPMLEAFNERFFRNHPYGQQTLIGTIEDLKNPSLTKMYEFYKTWYVPNNMALILVGDFDIETVMPMIKEKFGKWEAGKIPERPVYEEKDFNGREFVEVKMSPVKLAMLGFRAPNEGHPDELKIEICNSILSNQNQTGFLDKLMLDNELLAAQPMYMPYHEHGTNIMLIIPKLIGQKLDDAEDLVLNEIEKLKAGDFSEGMLESIKLELYRNYKKSMETNSYKMQIFASAFAANIDIEYLMSYPERLMSITKTDIVDAANKYFGENYLAFHSKMGFPKKEKIEKPGFKPIVKNSDAESDYAKRLAKIPALDIEPKYIDFEEDISRIPLNEDSELLYVQNPINDIYTLNIKFNVGYETIPILKYSTEMMNYASPKGTEVNDFNEKMASLGCSFYISGDESYTRIHLEGVEKNFEDAIQVLAGLILNPELKQSKIDILYEGEQANRKMERSEPDNVADALFEYVIYGEESDYLDRLSLKEIKKLEAETLTDAFKEATNYKMEVHYTGNKDPLEIANLIKKTLRFTSTKTTETPFVKDINQYKETTIFFVHKKKATQSKVYYLANGFKFTPEEHAVMDAFNMYFGGSFSGLVLQEIREYRSLAYSAGANFRTPALLNKEAYFIGYVGTQADKTLEAIQVFDSLINYMPSKKDRINTIKPYLLQSSVSSRPHFRNLSNYVVQSQHQGYKSDPAKFKRISYKKLNFEDIYKFYQKHLQNKPLAISIVGNKKQIDFDELEKYGKVVKIKEKHLFKK
jgi:zinc protease